MRWWRCELDSNAGAVADALSYAYAYAYPDAHTNPDPYAYRWNYFPGSGAAQPESRKCVLHCGGQSLDWRGPG